MTAQSTIIQDTLRTDADDLRKTVFEFGKVIDELDTEEGRMKASLNFGKICAQTNLIGGRLASLELREREAKEE